MNWEVAFGLRRSGEADLGLAPAVVSRHSQFCGLSRVLSRWVARALRLPPVVRTSSAPGGRPMPRALAETRKEFGQDYKEGTVVWYAVVAGADRATTGSRTARASNSACFALTSACFASTSACQRVSESHIGIPAQQQTNNSPSGMFSQNHVPIIYPLIIQPRPVPAPGDSRPGSAWPATSAARVDAALGGAAGDELAVDMLKVLGGRPGADL